jgi:hypothetical protein
MELAGALAAQGTQQWDGITRAPPFARGTAASAAPRRGRRRGMIHSDRGQARSAGAGTGHDATRRRDGGAAWRQGGLGQANGVAHRNERSESGELDISQLRSVEMEKRQ